MSIPYKNYQFIKRDYNNSTHPKGLTTIIGDLIVTGTSNISGDVLEISGGTSDDPIGQATLINGTVTVAYTGVIALSRIMLSRKTALGTVLGLLSIGTIVAGTSFVINSLDSTGVVVDDDSIVNYVVFNQV